MLRKVIQRVAGLEHLRLLEPVSFPPVVGLFPSLCRRPFWSRTNDAALQRAWMSGHIRSLRPSPLLEQDEMTQLFNRYNQLLNDQAYSKDHQYQVGPLSSCLRSLSHIL